MIAKEDFKKATVGYTDVQVTEKNYNPETKELTLTIDCIKITELENVELNLSLPASFDMQK